MKIPFYFIFIFIAMLKNADASQPISHVSRDAVYNIMIKPDLIINDRVDHFSYEDIVFEYQMLCDEELEKAKQTVVVKDIKNICEMSMAALASLKTPKNIAQYESYIKNRVLQNKTQAISHKVCSNKNSNLCEMTNKVATLADYSLKVIFYPLKALLTGDFSFN
ncbi:MAG: hypothetical protein MK008_13125 [Bdellovibrionales bacterium]|nr:hypothetical protein [Bdellovibrionales bacterium]